MRRILLFSLAITACLLLLIVVVRPAWPSHDGAVAPPPAIDSSAGRDVPILVATSTTAAPVPGLPAPTLAPTVISAAVETPVTITVALSDPQFSSLRIQYTRPDGDWTSLDASPHDDGKGGDQRAGDRVFTLVVKFERKRPQTISIRGRAKRGERVVFSPQVSLNVWPTVKMSFTYPPSWQIQGPFDDPTQSITITTFGSYDSGGFIPAGGADVTVFSNPLPSSSVEAAAADNLRGRGIESTEHIQVSGEAAVRITYLNFRTPDVAERGIAVYFAHRSLLYRFRLTYNAGDPLEPQFLGDFQQMLGSIHLAP